MLNRSIQIKKILKKLNFFSKIKSLTKIRLEEINNEITEKEINFLPENKFEYTIINENLNINAPLTLVFHFIFNPQTICENFEYKKSFFENIFFYAETCPLNCLYGWLMCLAMMGWFKACFDGTDVFATYMTRSSFGIYVVHYLVIAGLGYTMKVYTQLPPWAMYMILTLAVFALSPLIYEIIHRIPVIRWCVLGEK